MPSAKELQFLSYLRQNSRETLTEISKKTNIPISTLFDMLKELQGEVITKSTVLLNFQKLGYHARATILLKVNPESKEVVRKRLENCNQVNNLYKINNGWDFMLETVHSNIKELDNFLENLNQNRAVQEQQIHYHVDEIKREGFNLGS